MASNSANMSLVLWDEGSDPYDSGQLVGNWNKIDSHNHTAGSGVQIPTNGIQDSAITSLKIANGAIVNDDINSSAAIADTKLATISTSGKVANSATTATDANTANAIVARDSSGNFLAGTITANLSGNATTVTNGVYTTDTGTVTNTMLAGSISATKITDTAVTLTASQTVTNKTFTDPKINGSSTGTTTIVSANSSSNNYIITVPAKTGTLITNADTGTITNNMLQSDSIVINGKTATLGNISPGVTISGNPTGYANSLPGSPTNGDEIYYAADAHTGTLWHLRYRDPSGINSSTELTIGAGSKTVTVSTSVDYSIGSEIKIAYNPSNYMEGTVTAITPTTITFTPGATAGSGTYSSWTITLRNRAFKWEYMGGSLLRKDTYSAGYYGNSGGSTSVGNTSYQNLYNNTNLTITAPLAGRYIVEIWGQLSVPAISGAQPSEMFMSFKIGADTANDDHGFAVYVAQTGSATPVSGFRSSSIVANNDNTVLTCQFRTADTGNGIYVNRHGIALRPVQV